MEVIWFVRQRRWAYLLGYFSFIGMMAAGYYYNLTFIQFGLIDLGTRVVGMSETGVARNMTYLALITSVVAILAGLVMMRLGWSRRFRTKLRLAFGVVLAQTLLTLLVTSVRSEAGFFAWIVAASVALGVGVPATFSMAVDLVPVRYRGLAGAWITAAAYFPAAVLSANWSIEQFQASILWLMAAGALGLGVFAFVPLRLVDELARQHTRPEYGLGRFQRLDIRDESHSRGRLLVLILLMFGIYFVDSLGFLRLADTPHFFETAWQSPDLSPRLMIGVTHVLAAMVAGILYAALSEKELFLWVFGIFGLVHLMYAVDARGASVGDPALSMPLLYAVAVSLYTVINFAIWADLSTPVTISRNTALGVALSGWSATFLSTALALQMRLGGIPLEFHLRIVDSLAILFFLLVAAMLFFAPPSRSRRNTA